jgi:hypothetical protein
VVGKRVSRLMYRCHPPVAMYIIQIDRRDANEVGGGKGWNARGWWKEAVKNSPWRPRPIEGGGVLKGGQNPCGGPQHAQVSPAITPRSPAQTTT